MTDTQSGPDLLSDLAQEFAERYRRGERPALTEYTERYPELAEQIRNLFPALVVIEEFGSVAGQPPGGARDAVAVPAQLGEYRILREIGRGGMGIVYEAVQESLGRHVALKVLAQHRLAGHTQLERFQREAKAAARLHHTNIVPVFGVGSQEGVHYYAMQFIQGQGLDTVLGEVRRLRDGNDAAGGPPLTASIVRGLLTDGAAADLSVHARRLPREREPVNQEEVSPGDSSTMTRVRSLGGDASSDRIGSSEAQYFRGVARLGVQVAEALAYAHKQGIVHRDIKPSNLLLDTQGVVWLTDFGLVKDEEGDNLTQTGDLVGTIRYMAPERFEGRGDGRSDLYGLGATLYELLTLRPTFEDAQRARVIERVLHSEPVRPRKLDPHIPRDLETVVLKALAKEPDRRYQTAGEMAEDLRRFLADRPIRARRSSAAERTWRWCRRNPMVAVLLTCVATLLAGIAVSSSILAWRLDREHRDAVENGRQAVQAEREANERLWQSRLTEARAGRFSRQAGRGFDGLDALREAAALAHKLHVPEERLRDLRNEAIACMALTDVRSVRCLEELARADITTGFSPQLAFDGRWEVYARGDATGGISVRRLEDDRELAHFSRPGNVACILLFSPDGRYLAAKNFRLHSEQAVEYVAWDWRQGKMAVRQVCEIAHSPVIDFAFSRDSRQIILGGRRDGSLGVYDLASGTALRHLKLGRPVPWCIALHPDGKRLAVYQGAAVTIRDLDTGTVLASWKLAATAWGMAWKSDGTLLAAACEDHCIYLWDANTGLQRKVLQGHERAVMHVAFNRAGTLLASWGWDGVTRLWDPHSGKEMVGIAGFALEFSPDGRSLGYWKGDGEVGIWEVAHERVCRTLHGNQSEIHGLDFSPDGRLLASAGNGGFCLWDVAAARQVADVRLRLAREARFTPGNGNLITSSGSGVYRWPLVPADGGADGHLRMGPPQALPLRIGNRSGHASLARKGRRLAVGDVWEKGIVVDLDDPARQWLLIGHHHINTVALSPDGRWAATGTFKGNDVKLWDLNQGPRPQPVHTIPSGGAAALFSPDGRWLVVSGNRFYRVGSWEPVEVIRSKRAGTWSVFASDAPLMAVPYDDGHHIGLLDAESGRELAVLAADGSRQITGMALSADGGRLAVAGIDGAIQLWDLHAVRRQLADRGLDWGMPAYAAAAVAVRRLSDLRVDVCSFVQEDRRIDSAAAIEGPRPQAARQGTKEPAPAFADPAHALTDVIDFRDLAGATVEEFHAWRAALGKDFRLALLTSRQESGSPRLNAVAVREGVPRRATFCPEMTLAEGDRTWNRLSGGSRCVLTCDWLKQGQLVTSQLWVPAEGPWTQWTYSSLDLLAERIKKEAGYRPVFLHGPAPGGDGQYFRSDSGDEAGRKWKIAYALSLDQLQATAASCRDDGWRPDVLAPYVDEGHLRFMLVTVDNHDRVHWRFRMDMSLQEYRTESSEQKQRGLFPLALISYKGVGDARYAAIWVRYRAVKPPAP